MMEQSRIDRLQWKIDEAKRFINTIEKHRHFHIAEMPDIVYKSGDQHIPDEPVPVFLLSEISKTFSDSFINVMIDTVRRMEMELHLLTN